MPYTLVSAATLGFDLVRLPGGRAVAEVLLSGLAADAEGIARLAAAHPARNLSRDERGVRAVRGRRARELAAGVPHVRSATGGTATDRAAVLVDQLERGTIGDAPTLERLLREDVFGPERTAAPLVERDLVDEAVDVLADAAVGYWAAGILPPLVRRELTTAFDRATDAGPLPGRDVLDLGPATTEVRAFLDDIAGLDRAGRARWRAAVDDGRPEQRPWATAMHEASWAAHVSGRIRATAAAQLCAVQAFLDGGFDLHDGASGVWNAVAGCVQGIAMADLLDGPALDVLCGHWTRVAGRRPA